MGKLHKGEPGYKAERHNPLAKGYKVVIYDRRSRGRAAELEGISATDGRYAIWCKAHNEATTTKSMAKARLLMKAPMEWCQQCQHKNFIKGNSKLVKSSTAECPSSESASSDSSGCKSLPSISNRCPICGAGIMAEQVIVRGKIQLDGDYRKVVDTGTQTIADEMEIFCEGLISHSQDEMAEYSKINK